MMAQVNAGRVRFVGRGEYNNSTQYYVFDLVNYNGNSYYAKADTIANLPTNTTYWQLVAEKGNVGPIGLTGNGISSIEKTSTSGLVDTYTITFTNGNTTTFDVTNGKGIDRIEKTATVGNIDTYTIYFNDNSTSTFEVANGEVTREELEEEVDRLSMIYNLFPTTSDEDTEMTLDGTGEVKLKKIGLKGNTSQNTTTGANVMPVVNVTKTVNGVTITNNENGTITLNGTATAQVVYPITNTGDNTARRVPVTENDYKFMLYGDTNVSNDTYFLQVLFGTDTETTKFFAATDNGATSLHIATDRSIGYALIIRNGQSFNNHIIKPMGVLSTYTGGFEPYTYGASPNPDYPQDVQVVTGNNSIKVEGKNLFNAQIQAGTYNQATYTVASDGLITQSASDNSGWDASNRMFTLEAGTYTISIIGKDNSSRLQVRNITDNSDVIQTQNNSKTFTLTSKKKVALKTWGGSHYPLSYYIQIEKGNQVTSYQAYQTPQTYLINLGNIELCKIGDYQDRIYKDNGKWYLNKQIGKVVLNGSEDWELRSDITSVVGYKVYRNKSFDYTLLGNTDYGLSNYFKYVASGNIPNTIRFLHMSKYAIHCVISEELANDTTAFKAWLSTHNTTVYYVLETPTITEITDTTLIEQLDNLENAYSYDTQTNISQTNDDMPFILDVEALMSLKGVLN